MVHLYELNVTLYRNGNNVMRKGEANAITQASVDGNSKRPSRGYFVVVLHAIRGM